MLSVAVGNLLTELYVIDKRKISPESTLYQSPRRELKILLNVHLLKHPRTDGTFFGEWCLHERFRSGEPWIRVRLQVASVAFRG